jgi:hypothetical protein
MVTAFEHLQIGAARQRRLDPEARLARLERRRLDVFDTNIFFSMQDGGFHAGMFRAIDIGCKTSFARDHPPGASARRSGVVP